MGARGPERRPLGRTLSLHIVHELLFPTLLILAGLSLLALVAELFGYADLVVNRDFGVREVAVIALFRSVPMIGRAIPYSMLLGGLVALGRMAADRELLVVEASGVSPRRLVGPVALFAAVLTVVAVGISAFVEPWIDEGLAGRIEASVRRSSGSPIRSGVVTQIGEWRIVASEVSSRGDRLRGVAIWVPALRHTVFARTSSLTSVADGEKQIDIGDGVLLENGEKGPAYITFEHMRTTLDAGTDRDVQGAVDRLSWGTLADLAGAIRAERDPDDRRSLEAEWHRRLALPGATLCFGALVVPLALRPRRLSRSSGAVTGLAATLTYVALVQLSNGLVRTQSFPVALAVWLPNLSLLAASAALLALPNHLELGRRLRARWFTAKPTEGHHLDRLILDRYLLLRFLAMAVLCFVALLVAMLLIDVVDNLKWFTKYRSTLDEVMRFYAARLPLLISRVVPIALTVAAALTVSLLGVTGELMGMRACGISALRISIPILIPCLLTAVGYRAAVDRFVPHAAARATQIKRIEIKAQRSERLSFWSRDRNHLYSADRIDPLAGIAEGLTIYDLDASGLPVSRTDAESARHVGEGTWHLRSPRRVVVGPDGVHTTPADPLANLGEEFVTERDGAQLSVEELRDEIDTLEERGFDATAYRVDLQAKRADPLACVVLPALALLLATGGPPFRKPAQIVLLSVALIVVHFVLSSFAVSLGYRGALPPIVAGWGTAGTFTTVLTVLVLDRMRRSGALSGASRPQRRPVSSTP